MTVEESIIAFDEKLMKVIFEEGLYKRVLAGNQPFNHEEHTKLLNLVKERYYPGRCPKCNRPYKKNDCLTYLYVNDKRDTGLACMKCTSELLAKNYRKIFLNKRE